MSFEQARERAKRQIARGEELHRQLASAGADLATCKDAAHWLLDDGGAARQGDDPSWFLRHTWLADLYPEAMRIEREAVERMSAEDFESVITKLRGLGPTRAKDVGRLVAHREQRAAWPTKEPRS